MKYQDSNRKNPLPQEVAEKRKSLLLNSENNQYNVHYDLALVIRRSVDKNIKYKSTDFEGKLTIKFDYHPKENIVVNENLFFDFTGEVYTMIINDSLVNIINYKNNRIFPDTSILKPFSSNEVTILFSCKFSHQGVGLHHYIDPADGKEYLYTQFEPYECHLMFPCFDQPDLRASLQICVIAPNEWTVLSNEQEKWSKLISQDTQNDIDIKGFLDKMREEERVHLLDNANILKLKYVLHLFKRTPKIASYLFALCAGHFYCYNNPFEYEIPLRIFCKESLKDCGDVLEFFKITMEGMEWYKQFFGFKYPFNKYDQVFCPEVNMVAMENVGLVTYADYFCFKETPTERQKTYFAIIVLHEMAHMWFGNLVTMKWWDDLWLNESFATFISHLCLSEAKDLNHYTISWLIFNSAKGDAFNADQDSTTHPVMCEVNTTEVAETNFDEIVYEKGSSILKQLFKFIGRENFKKGVQNYFQKYKWNNTVFINFIDQMVEATGNEKLYHLCDSFLRKSGLTQISANWTTNDKNQIDSFNIKQIPCLDNHPNLQTHFCDMIVLYENGTKLTFDDITIKNETNTFLNRLLGINKPDAVIVNYNDWAYFKTCLDQKSIKFLQNHLYDTQFNLSILTRQIFYRSIFDNARDSVISSFQYLQIMNSLLPQETNQELISYILNNVYSIITNFIPVKYNIKYSKIIYNIILKLLSRSNQTDDTIKTFILNLIKHTCPENKDQISLLINWLEKGFFLPNNDNNVIKINSNLFQQTLRFNSLYKIFASTLISLEDKNKLIEIECKKDNYSDDSDLAKFQCIASLPDKKIKEELFNMYVYRSTDESLYKMMSSMSGFVHLSQLELVEEFLLVKFFEVCLNVGKINDHFYTESFIDHLSPVVFVRRDVIDKIENLIHKANSVSVKRKLIEILDDMKRHYKAHNLCEQFLSEY